MTVHGWLRYDVLRRLLPSDVASILEIGTGLGSLGSLLAQRYRYVGLEPDPVSYETARDRVGPHGEVLRTSGEAYDGDTFDAVCAFEVLEHLRDDVGALRRWRRHLRPGGWMIVSVPAGRERFGPSDARQGHYRRYDREDLEAALHEAGYVEVSVVTYGFPIGYLLHAISHLQARRKPHAESLEDRTAASARWMQPGRGRARRLAAAPFAVLQRPFAGTRLGTGLLARARLPRS